MKSLKSVTGEWQKSLNVFGEIPVELIFDFLSRCFRSFLFSCFVYLLGDSLAESVEALFCLFPLILQ